MIGELDDQNAILGHQPDNDYQTDLAVDIERTTAQQKGEDGGGKPEWNRRHQDRRADKALELSCQNKKYYDNAEGERLDNAARGIVELSGLSGKGNAHSHRQAFSGK